MMSETFSSAFMAKNQELRNYIFCYAAITWFSVSIHVFVIMRQLGDDKHLWQMLVQSIINIQGVVTWERLAATNDYNS